MKKQFVFVLTIVVSLYGCRSGAMKSDASGTFEADEVIVSSELPGKILLFSVEEGDLLQKDSIVGSIDAADLSLQRDQVAASIGALSRKTSDVQPQIKLLNDQLIVQQSQIAQLQKEKTRTGNLLKKDAATGKQFDDINAQLDVAEKQLAVTRQQINVQRNAVSTQNRGLLSEGDPLQKRVEQLTVQLRKAEIVNPVTGIVLLKYAQQGEITAPGKALYKIADLSEMTLRAYLSGNQLSQVKLGQTVTVLADSGATDYRTYQGKIGWISEKAEFTPKTIQTKEERANLVYAIKVSVKNDGYLKIGMYAEILLNPQP